MQQLTHQLLQLLEAPGERSEQQKHESMLLLLLLLLGQELSHLVGTQPSVVGVELSQLQPEAMPEGVSAVAFSPCCCCCGCCSS